MSNPYESPRSDIPAKPMIGLRTWSRMQWITATVCVLSVVVLSIVSLVLISQALRLNAEAASLSARFQASHASTARSSWIGGVAAIVGAILATGSLVLVFRNKLAVPMAILAVTAMSMIAMSVLFKPS